MPDDDASKPHATASPLPAPNESLRYRRNKLTNKPVDGASASPRTELDNMTEEARARAARRDARRSNGRVSFPGPSRELLSTRLSARKDRHRMKEKHLTLTGSDSSDGSESDDEGSR